MTNENSLENAARKRWNMQFEKIGENKLFEIIKKSICRI
jgi:hypothetical protein